MKFAKGDIVKSATGYAPGVWVITDLAPNRPTNPYIGTHLVTGKQYKLGDNSLGQKIGTATPEYLNGTLTEEKQERQDDKFDAGQQRAELEARMASNPIDKARWELLAKAKPGDRIIINRFNALEHITFKSVIPSGQKYVLLAASKTGKVYKYPLGVVIVAVGDPVTKPLFGSKAPAPIPPVKRTDEEILEELRDVECSLSPENLSSDGEASGAQIRIRGTQLRRQKAQLERELGRVPTFEELYPELSRFVPSPVNV